MKKGYLIEKEDNSHYSYTLESDHLGYAKIVKLFYSKIGNWSSICRGKRFVKAEMDGNFNTTFEFQDKTITLDLGELDAVYNIAKLMNKCEKKTFCKYKVINK